MALAGAGAGISELTALAATSELAPTAKRGTYNALMISSLFLFCPSTLWAQLISTHSSWRYVGLLCALWSFIGFVLVLVFYFPPPRVNSLGLSKSEILAQIDIVGGLLSISGIILFIGGLIWGGNQVIFDGPTNESLLICILQYEWTSVNVIAPLIIGATLIIAFAFWEIYGTKFPMFPSRFRRESRTFLLTLVIIFVSGVNFFSVLVFWPTQSFNVYGHDPIGVGIRSLPPPFGTLGGAIIVLLLLTKFRGEVRGLMAISRCLMTAGCGAMASINLSNLNDAYAYIFLASLGVGGVVVPASIITTIICPDDLIATVTSLTLAIRVPGGSIGYAIYYSVLSNKLVPKLTANIVSASVTNRIVDPKVIEEITILTAGGFLDQILHLPGVDGNVTIWNELVIAGKEGYASAYTYVYLVSIAFGVISLVASLFLGNISKYVDDHVAVTIS
jgi:hypothetical protein